VQIPDATILISGGSSGLGAACAADFVERGSRIVIADLQPPRDDDLANHSHVMFVKTDVTSEDDVANAISAGEERFGNICGVVTCAGILKAERMLGRSGVASLQTFRQVIEVNLIGTFNVMRLAAAAIAKREPDTDGERGVMVATSSVAAFDGQIGQASYSASKGAVASMTLPLARELGGKGIRVVSVAPGVFETPMMEAAPEKVRESLLSQSPFPRRFGQPAEFAALVRHIFENTMLNGCVMRLDGGIRMAAR
jgi:NAD(P)-dependent dehydrogenase (short-subunit alcohol dehydrogenase family)